MKTLARSSYRILAWVALSYYLVEKSECSVVLSPGNQIDYSGYNLRGRDSQLFAGETEEIVQ